MGKKFGVRWKYATPEEAFAAKRRQEAAWNEKQRAMRAINRAMMKAGFPPPEVDAERERALAAPRTIGQEICGDPLAGRSALDRMRIDA